MLDQKSLEAKKAAHKRRSNILNYGFAIFTAVAWWIIQEFFPNFFSAYTRNLPKFAAVFVGTVVVLGVGYAFYKFRQKYRERYGFVEVGFALMTAVFSLLNLYEKITTPGLIALVSAVYLVVRGLDNIDQAARQDR